MIRQKYDKKQDVHIISKYLHPRYLLITMRETAALQWGSQQVPLCQVTKVKATMMRHTVIQVYSDLMY